MFPNCTAAPGSRYYIIRTVRPIKTRPWTQIQSRRSQNIFKPRSSALFCVFFLRRRRRRRVFRARDRVDNAQVKKNRFFLFFFPRLLLRSARYNKYIIYRTPRYISRPRNVSVMQIRNRRIVWNAQWNGREKKKLTYSSVAEENPLGIAA